MNANQLIAQALNLCHRIGRPFPAEVKGYAWDWQRQRYDLAWCWGMVKRALVERRAMCTVEAEVRRYHAGLQAAKDARERALCKPILEGSPRPDLQHHCAPDRHRQARAAHSPVERRLAIDHDEWDPEPWDDDDIQASQPVLLQTGPEGRRRDPEPLPTPAAKPARRTGTKAHRVKELLTAHVVRRGPISVSKLESIARSEGLLRQDQPISRSSTFRRIAAELGIESHRIGFGSGASYVWRLRPPEWTRGSDQARELPDGCP